VAKLTIEQLELSGKRVFLRRLLHAPKARTVSDAIGAAAGSASNAARPFRQPAAEKIPASAALGPPNVRGQHDGGTGTQRMLNRRHHRRRRVSS